ncbi:MAG TPA: glycosyltransferase family 4 protein [Chitinophagaceae bacterium]|nr:glycosyltransferase family 4 protein [Chitinophagaceae bacterium]
MKILFVVQNYYPSIGGTQIFFQKLAEYCVQHYHDEVTVFTTNSYFGPEKSNFKRINEKEAILNGVKVKRFSFYRFHYPLISFLIKLFVKLHLPLPSFISSFSYAPLSPLLMKAIREAGADVIMSGTSHYMHNAYAVKRKRSKTAKPFVMQGAIHFSDKKKDNVVTGFVLKNILHSDMYISNTDYEKERLIKMGVPAENIVTGGISVECEVFEKGDRNFFREKFLLHGADVLFCYTGRMEPAKNVEFLINAFEICSKERSDFHLALAGYTAEKYQGQLLKKINALPDIIKERIHFLPNISAEEKTNLLHAADVFVLPSVNESFGMVFLEAWSCKKPVIGMSTGAIRSVVSHGYDGLLAEQNNMEDLCSRMKVLADSKELRSMMGENGCTKVKQNFTWDIVAKKYRDTFIAAIEKFHVQRGSSLD